MSNEKTQLPPELVEKYIHILESTPRNGNWTHNKAEKCAQIAVEYTEGYFKEEMSKCKSYNELRKQRDELLEAMREFTNAIESEEITIQENCDNDGWENCGGRLYETFKQLINKIDGK